MSVYAIESLQFEMEKAKSYTAPTLQILRTLSCI